MIAFVENFIYSTRVLLHKKKDLLLYGLNTKIIYVPYITRALIGVENHTSKYTFSEMLIP